MPQIELLFDNGGGILLQTSRPKYTHAYDDGKQAAHDVVAILCGSDTRLWDGNEPEYYSPGLAAQAINGAHHYNLADIRNAMELGAPMGAGYAECDFWDALGAQKAGDR